MSAEPVSVVPRFPQLAVAKDPERMRAVLQQHLRPLAGRTYQIRRCRVSFSRDRSAQRCLLEYILDLVEPATGREWSQRVTGVLYAGGRTGRIWRQLERAEKRRGRPETGPRQAETTAIPDGSSAFAPFSYVPDLDMLLQVFPYDHRLPTLGRLLTGPPPELAPLLLARFGAGDWRAAAWDATVLRYRVDMRATLRVMVRAREAATGREEERRFYAKVYREDQGAEADRGLRELTDKAGGSFGVAPPVAYLESLHTLVQEEVPGTSFLDILWRENDAVPAARCAARALAALHRLEVAAPRRRSLEDEFANLEREGDRLRAVRPDLASTVEEVLGAVVAGLEEIPPTPVHGDLKPGHILLDGDRVTLLDFDRLALADPLLDVANLLVRLANWWSNAGHPDCRPGGVARAFVEEYFAHAPAAWRARLPLRYAMALLIQASGPLRGHRDRSEEQVEKKNGPARIELLVREAQDSAAGSIW